VTEPASGAAPTGYRIVLPPGWARIPLRSGTDAAVAAVMEAITAGLPAEATEQIGAELRKAVAAAADGTGLDLYLPVSRPPGPIIAASFVVAAVAFGATEPLDPMLLLAGLAAGPDAQRVIVDGSFCSRAESTAPADPARGAAMPSRRVEYVLPVPDDQDRWVVVSFSALRAPDPTDDPSTVWVELFDAIMSTFRWRRTTRV
jgi:hypothetical protein